MINYKYTVSDSKFIHSFLRIIIRNNLIENSYEYF